MTKSNITKVSIIAASMLILTACDNDVVKGVDNSVMVSMCQKVVLSSVNFPNSSEFSKDPFVTLLASDQKIRVDGNVNLMVAFRGLKPHSYICEVSKDTNSQWKVTGYRVDQIRQK